MLGTVPDWLSIFLTLLVMLIGLAGIVVPVLPGLPVIWLAALGYALIEGFGGAAGGLAFAVISVLGLAGVAVELLTAHYMARRSGASWQAVVASIALGIVGLVFFPPLGAPLGAALGMFSVEYLRQDRDWRAAWRAVLGYAAGVGWSVALQLGLALGMIGVWVIWVLFRGAGS